MANKIYYQEDCNLSMLEGQTIAVIGYGSQGHAHALNAKESGCNVIIGLYEGSKSWAKAEAQGFEVYTAAEAAKRADIIMILINDELQADMYKKDIVALSGLKDDLTYIIKTAQYMLYIKEKGGCLTFPTVGEEQNITGLYNPNLLIKAEMTEIVSNDVKMDENNRIFVITGPNSGGKTVYLDSIGLAQLFFQLGLPVPAVSAEMKPLKTIASLYVRNVTVNNGRLADEVGRLKECLDHISRDSLLLLDETFSSTSAFEGVFLAESLIKYLSDIGCYAVYVTHFHELSQRLTELNREEKYNIHMLTADNENGKRTYKIVPYHGFDSEKSLAREIVIENGLGFLFD